MTQDEIIGMAKAVGGIAYVNRHYLGETAFAFGPEAFKAFTQLVAEKATEEANARANASWTLMCKKMVAAEREACAKICDEQANSLALAALEKYRASFIADAIRARGQE